MVKNNDTAWPLPRRKASSANKCVSTLTKTPFQTKALGPFDPTTSFGYCRTGPKPITKDVLDRAIDTEEEAASREHQAQEAWFDRQHGTVMLKLTDGRVFGAEPGFIPSLRDASPKQLRGLRASGNGVYLIVEDLDLHISVDGLVTRIMEKSPLAIKRSGARLVGLTTSPAKAISSARNGRLGGRPKSKPKMAAQQG